jgi:small subunit ribosomal protein S17
MSETQRNARRVMQGIVSSAKMDKTIAVSVERRFAHPKYGKSVRSHKKYYAHDEGNTASVGDTVEIVATRPLSKLKRWRLVRIVEANRMAQASAAEGEALAIDLAGTKRADGGVNQ